MNRRLPDNDRRFLWLEFALLVLIGLSLSGPLAWGAAPPSSAPPTWADAPPSASAPLPNPSPLLGFAAFWDSILGNQTRMIQVGLVIIAIGIFILTRSIR